MRIGVLTIALSTLILAGCGGGSSSMNSVANAPGSAPSYTVTAAPGRSAQCAGSAAGVSPPGPAPTVPSGLTVADNLRIQTIAHVAGARQLTSLPNGDLLVGTNTSNVYLVPDADGSNAGYPTLFARIPDTFAHGVAFDQSTCTIFVGAQSGVYAIPYNQGDQSARRVTKIAIVRPGGLGDHASTTVIVSNGTLYAGVGSSCNACVETDPTRATIQQMNLDGSNMTSRAIRIRNAIALAVDPETGHIWTGAAGQDHLASSHPYELFDDVSSHPGTADYGWPDCEENHHAYAAGAKCADTVQPLVEFPSYSTPESAVFYPVKPGTHGLPFPYRGGFFVALHGSWHTHPGTGGYFAAPEVVFVPMQGDTPQTAVNWKDPTAQWQPFITGFQLSDQITRIGRPTGLAVGVQGTLFIADDKAGAIYRVRP